MVKLQIRSLAIALLCLSIGVAGFAHRLATPTDLYLEELITAGVLCGGKHFGTDTPHCKDCRLMSSLEASVRMKEQACTRFHSGFMPTAEYDSENRLQIGSNPARAPPG